MRHPNSQLIDRLAAEFVLGTLRGPARSRFTRWLSRYEDAAAAVRCWEDRFAWLALRVRPEQPSPQVWPAIARRIGPPAATSARQAPVAVRRARWPALALAASLAVVAIGAWLYLRSPVSAPQWQAAAELRPQPTAQIAWRVEFDAASSQLRTSAEQPLPTPARGAHELWALADGSAPPVSLGLLPASGRRLVRLNQIQLAALSAARKLAVSEEPPGGSPTGLPTGPVVLVVPRNALHFS